MKKTEGLFTLYFDEEESKALLEIAPQQLGEIYLCNVMREAGDGYFADSGAMLDNFPFTFHKVGKKIQFIHKNVAYRADADTPIAESVRRGWLVAWANPDTRSTTQRATSAH
jgi:hypothetical protein